MDKHAEIFKKNVDAALAQKGWSQNRLAAAMKVAGGDLSNWLNDKTAMSVRRAGAVADALEIPLHELFKPDMEPMHVMPEPIMTSHDVVAFLFEGLKDREIRESVAKALSALTWERGTFGLSPVKRQLVERLAALDDAQVPRYVRMIEAESCAASGGKPLKPNQKANQS